MTNQAPSNIRVKVHSECKCMSTRLHPDSICLKILEAFPTDVVSTKTTVWIKEVLDKKERCLILVHGLCGKNLWIKNGQKPRNNDLETLIHNKLNSVRISLGCAFRRLEYSKENLLGQAQSGQPNIKRKKQVKGRV